MSWKFIYASEVGTSHLDQNTECQDSCIVSEIRYGQNRETTMLLCLVADGAGSAYKGKEGAELACHYASEIICQWAQSFCSLETINNDIVREWIHEIKARIKKKADDENRYLRDYACTLIGAIIGPSFVIYFQVGDGAIVVEDNGDYRPIFWPNKGEYENTTFFITDDEINEHIQIEINKCKSPDEIALFSDGLERLALQFANKTAHKPFFEPMFTILRKEFVGLSGNLSSLLGQFLQSHKVNERTNDDKTLIMATRKVYEDVNGYTENE